MDWNTCIHDYELHLRLEKSLSENSIDAYCHDVRKLQEFFVVHDQDVIPENVTLDNLRDFIYWLNINNLAERSQARIISGLKGFYEFLQLDNIVDIDPTELLESPKISKKLPVYLTIKEIDDLIKIIDVSTPEGHRNRAMLETLYSCGLRVSELVNLRIHNLYFKEGFIRVVGKGDKERLVPISDRAIQEISDYNECRCHMNIAKDEEDFLFLNRRGKHLTRVMVFLIIKDAANKAGITKNISPHTFRHSFATHLVSGGADLRSVQEMLGHESILTTEIYTHLDTQHLHDTIMLYHPRR